MSRMEFLIFLGSITFRSSFQTHSSPLTRSHDCGTTASQLAVWETESNIFTSQMVRVA
jgi:hypothetical protein